MQKATYIIGAAEAALNKIVDFENLHKFAAENLEDENLADEDTIKKLSTLNGIGVWTAEMFLLFSLGRKNVLSCGDLAIRCGIINLHKLKSLSKKDFSKYKE